MKKIAALIISAILLITVFSGCGSIYRAKDEDKDPELGSQETASEDKPKEVYYTIGMHIILPYWQDHRFGLEAAAQELGVDVVFTGENGSDALRQLDIFEQVVKKKPAGILVCPIDMETMTKPINKAMDMGIPVICIDNDAPNSKRLTYFGTDNYQSGYIAGDIIGESLKGKGDVGILTIPGIYSMDERQRGFEECIKSKYPDINVVAVMDDQADPSKAANIAEQMFKEFPSITGLFGTNAASGVGAAIALSENQKLNEIKVVAFDKDSEVLELVDQGKIEAALVQRTFTMSYYGLKFLYDYNHNSQLKNGSSVSMMPDMVDTGIIVVTKDNVDDFL